MKFEFGTYIMNHFGSDLKKELAEYFSTVGEYFDFFFGLDGLKGKYVFVDADKCNFNADTFYFAENSNGSIGIYIGEHIEDAADAVFEFGRSLMAFVMLGHRNALDQKLLAPELDFCNAAGFMSLMTVYDNASEFIDRIVKSFSSYSHGRDIALYVGPSWRKFKREVFNL